MYVCIHKYTYKLTKTVNLPSINSCAVFFFFMTEKHSGVSMCVGMCRFVCMYVHMYVCA